MNTKGFLLMDSPLITTISKSHVAHWYVGFKKAVLFFFFIHYCGYQSCSSCTACLFCKAYTPADIVSSYPAT